MSAQSYDDILAHARALVQERYPRVHIGRPELCDVPPGTIVAGTTWSALRRARWIISPDVHLGDGVTKLDLARSWIDMHTKLPVRRKHADKPPEWAPLVLYARPGAYADMAYVDIRSAYRRILEIAGYDVEYRALRWLAAGDARDGLGDMPKLSYSAIIAMSAKPRSHVLRVSRQHRPVAFSLYNRYANVCLYTLARDVLHAIYSDALRSIRSLVYANTDGYIVSARDVEPLLALINDWCFDARVKRAGDVTVHGTASFSFADGSGTRRRSSLSTRTEPADQRFVRWLHKYWRKAHHAVSDASV